MKPRRPRTPKVREAEASVALDGDTQSDPSEPKKAGTAYVEVVPFVRLPETDHVIVEFQVPVKMLDVVDAVAFLRHTSRDEELLRAIEDFTEDFADEALIQDLLKARWGYQARKAATP